MLGQRSRLPGAGARRRAGERLERLDPADAAAGGSWPGPTERLAPRTRLDVPWCQPTLRCAGSAARKRRRPEPTTEGTIGEGGGSRCGR